MRKLTKLSMIFALTGSFFSLINGCSSTPKCGDQEVKDLVMEIVEEDFNKTSLGLVKAIGEIDAIRTIKHNTENDSYECAARLNLEINAIVAKMNQNIEITYKVETLDNKEQFYVTIYGLDQVNN